MSKFSTAIKNAPDGTAALCCYSQYVNACDAIYLKTLKSSGGSQTRLKRNTEAYKRLMLQMREVHGELSKRGILRRALAEHPMKY